MKTKTFLQFCFFATLLVNSASAQKSVVKESFKSPVAFTLECTGDFIYGEVVYEVFFTPNGWVEKVRKASLTGYEDETLTVPTGREYELSQCDNGQLDMMRGESTARILLDGKIVALLRYAWHTTINANGTVTADFVISSTECK
jgi:hypothetical protein